MALFDNLLTSFKAALRTDMFSMAAISNEVYVTETSIKSITAYTAGVNSIANSIASIPFKLRKGSQVLDSDLSYLIKEKPNPYQTAYDFKRIMLNDMLYRGTAFAFINRDANSGKVISITPIEYTKVTEAKMVDGELYYMVNNIPVHNDDLLIFKNSGTGAFGLDPISIFAESLGVTLSSTRYTKKAFEGDGSNIKGVVTSTHKLNENQKKEFRDSIQANYTGSNSKSLLVLDAGFDFKPVSLSPDQMKLIETRNIQVAEIARMLNVPIYIVASETPSNYNSIEGQQLDFYKRTLSPIIYMIEAEFKHKLLSKREIKDSYYFKGAIESLLRGDSRSRADFYKELFYMGAISPEEIRELEDMNADVKGETFIQANLIPSNLVKDFYDSKIALDYSKSSSTDSYNND